MIARWWPWPSVRRLRAAFAASRPQLEEEFLRQAQAGAKPRGLRWVRCESDGEPLLVRDRVKQLKLALLAVTVHFEAIPGSDMEGHDAVSRPRVATAVFVWRRGAWATDGHAVFNLAPAEVVTHFKGRYTILA